MSDVDRTAAAGPAEPGSHEARGLDPAGLPEIRRRRRWPGITAGLVALLGLAGAIAYGAQRHLAEEQMATETAAAHRDFVPSVRVATVREEAGPRVVTLPGTTLAFTQADIFARASGYIDKLDVDIGDRVKAGDLLAEITAPELDHQIAQAQATLAQTEAAVEQAEANRDLSSATWQRDRPLVQQGWTTKEQGDVDRLTLRAQQAATGVAEANVAAQQALILSLQQQKAYQRVAAPFDGVVTARNVNIGDLVTADATGSTQMFTLMQSNVIRVQVFVPQSQALGVVPGTKATVRVPELPGRAFPGTVTRIADALQPGTRTLLVEIDIANADGALPPGIYCAVELDVPRKPPVLIVPAEAIVFDRDGLHVATVVDGVVHMRKISVSRDLGTEVEVGDGVDAGDVVVLTPPVTLVEGSKVSVRPADGTN